MRGCVQGSLLSAGILLSFLIVLQHGQMMYVGVDTDLVQDLVPEPKDIIAERATNVTIDNVDRIVYNRVPKCGSSAVESVLRHLAVLNNFTYYRSKLFRDPLVPEEEQRDLATRLAIPPPPFLYDRHIHFVDFKKYWAKPPIYVNLIRHPLEQRVSAYYYRRTMAYNKDKSGSWLNQTFDQCVESSSVECVGPYAVSLGYMCGQEEYCRKINDDSLAAAKRHLLDEYSIVGITEDLDGFFFVLEKVLPGFFKGATAVYQPLKASLLSKFRTPNRGEISDKTRELLNSVLRNEIELYELARQRFYELLASLQVFRRIGKLELNKATIPTQW